MLKKSNTRRWLALIVALAVAGIFAGGVVGGLFDGLPSEDFEASLRDDAVVRVADIPAQEGLPARSVLVQPTSTGFLCLWDAATSASESKQGGCNSAADPLGGRKFTISLAYEGGPATRNVSDARLIGLASLEVASIRVLMTDGSLRSIPMRRDVAVASEAGSFRAFGYRFPRSDFKRGLGPTAVIGLNARGTEVERLTTGFGG
ncbi:MAG: hypothetical protein H0U46_04575 [Actinobacteria bacterium]|nr:hypothetical protein [Actinomycetota bacterium]